MMRQTGDNIAEDKKFKFLTNDFTGGMRRNISPAKLSENEYALLINGRSRYGTIRPIKLPANLSNQMPSGLFQGIYGFDTILIVFKDGKLFARDYSQPINAFAIDPAFQMDQNVETIHASSVPVSWMNIQRKASDAADNAAPVFFQNPVTGTPQALVCQDGGQNRPRLVFSVGSSRVANDIDKWRNDELTEEDTREYVPRGRQMLYHDGIFYMVSADGKKIYRSVTGRPLDFVVAIDVNGDKLSLLTTGEEEAARLSYAVDFNEITCLRTIASPMPSDANLGPPFFVGTLKGSWIVFPDYSQTLFNEPTFTKIPLFPTGPLNQNSFTELLGDVAFIADHGPTSFNSVQTLQNEGKNAPFYDDVFKLFEGVVQDVTCAITSDNYGFLAVKTVYGYGVLVYDTQRQKFVSLDIYPEVEGGIKQFAEIKVAGRRRLFFITSSQIFEAFAGTETATLSLYCREEEATDPEIQLTPRRVRVVLRDIEEAGMVTLTPFVDGKRGSTSSQEVSASTPPITVPLSLPFGEATTKQEQVLTFTLDLADKGHTVGVFLTMNFLGDLIEIEPITEGEMRDVTDSQAELIFAENKTL